MGFQQKGVGELVVLRSLTQTATLPTHKAHCLILPCAPEHSKVAWGMHSKRIHIAFTTLLWSVIVGLSLLLVVNTLPYYWKGESFGILPEKGEHLNSTLYLTVFYVHVGPSIALLLLPVFQFLVRVKGKNARRHKQVGLWYVWIALAVVCPTGLYLALFAKGGAVGQYGFMMQGVVLAIFTWLGWKYIRKGNVKAHSEWMIRSYAMATGALTFRLLHQAFYFFDVPENAGYSAAQWLSMTINLILAELLISYIRKRKTKSKALQLQHT